MSQFESNLKTLPDISHIAHIELWDDISSHPVATIENVPGKSGSVAVYNYLKQEFDQLTPQAARIGLDLFAEHVDSARETPGAHPNIDRLFRLIESNNTLLINVIEKSN